MGGVVKWLFKMAITMQTGRVFVFVSLLLSTLLVCGAADSCNVSSEHWCDSEETARACGVLGQCKQHEWPLQVAADPVNFTLYYESLCPYCRSFIVDQLYPAYQKISAILNLELVPYGNAKESQYNNKWNFTCQHGPNECLGNLIATCTINIVKDISVYLPFLYCTESSNLLPRQAAQQCAKSNQVPINDILTCTSSDAGNRYEHAMAARTDSLNPKHQYVPWVTLNGVHTDSIQNEAQTNFLKLICDTYKGTKPSGCSNTSVRVTAA